MVSVDWSLLPSDLINRIANCLLAASDLDYYMDFRSVCQSWRSATDDPKLTSDRRFSPCHWVIIDHVYQSNTYLFLNTTTGRVLRKELPLLRDYYISISTRDGLLVLIDTKSYQTVSVFNPFTGYLVRFIAPMPDEFVLSATPVSGSSPKLLLLCNKVSFIHSPRTVYMADSSSESFIMYEDRYACPLIRLSVRGIYNNGELGSVSPFPLAMAKDMMDLMRDFDADPTELSLLQVRNRCYLLESAGEILIIIKLKDGMEIYRMDTERYALENVKNIGNRAIFLDGHCRCISVNVGKFPSVDANCIYYTKSLDCSNDIHMYNILNRRDVVICKDISYDSPPYTIIQLICSRLNDAYVSITHKEWRHLVLG